MKYYKCNDCSEDWLQLYSIFAKPDTKCKKCKSKNIKSRTVNKVI